MLGKTQWKRDSQRDDDEIDTGKNTKTNNKNCRPAMPKLHGMAWHGIMIKKSMCDSVVVFFLYAHKLHILYTQFCTM